jgi:hypothetical protein
MSEVFLAAFRNRLRYQTDRTDARPWLYGIATKVISDQLRRGRRDARLRAALPGPRPAELLTDEIADRLAARQERPRLLRALAQLPAAERELVLLVSWAELTYAPSSGAGRRTSHGWQDWRAGLTSSPRRRLALLAAGAALATAAATAIVVSAPSADRLHQPSQSGPALSARTANGLTASQVLLLAARSARSVPDPTPGPGQYLFFKTTYRGDPYEYNATTETWVSWDGQHGGLSYRAKPRPYRVVLPDCATDPNSSGPLGYQVCPGIKPFATNMPSTSAGMLALIRHWNREWNVYWAQAHHLPGAMAETAVLVENSAGEIGNGMLYPNSVNALLFAAMSRLTGIAVVNHAVTISGQSGIGVATVLPDAPPLTGPAKSIGALVELVFDPTTYQFLGVDDYNLSGQFRDRPGLLGSGFFGTIARTFSGKSYTDFAVVSKVGQLPPG